jgi:hypothetical protein
MTHPPSIATHVKHRFPALLADFQGLESHCHEYEPLFVDRFVPEADPSGDPALTLRDKTRLLIMAVTCHARALTWGLIEALNQDTPPGAFLLARAHFEVAGLMAYLLARLRKHRNGQLPEADLHDLVVRLNMATKKHAPGTPSATIEKTSAVSVAAFADAVDKLPDLQAGGLFRSTWEWLSEFCHPNVFSRVISGQRLVGREVHFDSYPSLKEDALTPVLVASNISQEVFFYCRQEVLSLVEQLGTDA